MGNLLNIYRNIYILSIFLFTALSLRRRYQFAVSYFLYKFKSTTGRSGTTHSFVAIAVDLLSLYIR